MWMLQLHLEQMYVLACCVLLQVHRLDVNTGGLLLVAKTRAAGTALAADLAEHKMQKR
jgi:23S rRNA-/tRNA-specific pseudouridylate synthase